MKVSCGGFCDLHTRNWKPCKEKGKEKDKDTERERERQRKKIREGMKATINKKVRRPRVVSIHLRWVAGQCSGEEREKTERCSGAQGVAWIP